MNMKYPFLLLLPLVLAGCQQDSAPTRALPAARIGKQTITEQDINDRLPFLSAEDREFAKTPLGHQNLVQIITREKLIAADARTTGIADSDEYRSLLADKRAQLDQIYNEFAADTLERLWYHKLEESGSLAVSNSEVDDYFKKYPYEMTIKQIIVDNAQTADQVLRTLKAYPSRWKEMERQYSTAPEALKQFSFMPGEYLDNIAVIAANSPSGKPQGFFKTAQGFHIIMKTGERRLSKKDAEPRIREVLKNKKTDDVLDSLKNKYEVVIYEKSE